MKGKGMRERAERLKGGARVETVVGWLCVIQG